MYELLPTKQMNNLPANEMTVVPANDLDQTWHIPSLTSFALIFTCPVGVPRMYKILGSLLVYMTYALKGA